MKLQIGRTGIVGIAMALGMIAVLGYGYHLLRQPKALTPWQWNLPAHFATPRIPEDNPMSEEKFQLGRSLFYDTRLSGNGTFACASCHFQNLAFTDGKAVSAGSTGELTARSAQGLANSAYHPYFTWANYSLASMERQMLNPLLGENPVEMGVNDATKPIILRRLQADTGYVEQFRQVFPQEEQPIHLINIIKAISAFQRGMISANSKYDRHLMKKVTLSDSEERGRTLFFSDKAQCSQCHGSFNFNDQVIAADGNEASTPFHNTGLYNLDGKGAFPDGNRGIMELSNKPQDMGMFRAPSLRNVGVTAPYMHDGSIATLEQVLDFYAAHGRVVKEGPFKGDGRKNPMKDKRIDKIQLSSQDKQDVIAFLNTLTDEEFLTNPRFSDPFKHAAAAK
jgi:cytochrome c peroxidase